MMIDVMTESCRDFDGKDKTDRLTDPQTRVVVDSLDTHTTPPACLPNKRHTTAEIYSKMTEYLMAHV